jgi:VIT1/CCC1 family predicted Fe2+/Mn2+ transporter
MRLGRRRLAPHLLPLSLGLADGILNALTIATGVVLHGARDLDISLAGRVALVAFVTSGFTVFVAEYAQRRAQVARAEVQLNMTSSGRLATSRLGRAVIAESVVASAIASSASLVGALVPLGIGTVSQQYAWFALVFAVVALALLGAALAHVVGGSRSRWASVMAMSAVVLAFVGDKLHIAS